MNGEIHAVPAVPVVPPKEAFGILDLHEPMMLVALEADFGFPEPFGPLVAIVFIIFVGFDQDLIFVPAFDAGVAASVLDGDGAAGYERCLLTDVFIALLSEGSRGKDEQGG